MGFDVNLEKETGEVLARVADPKNLLHRLLERCIADEPRLAEIDWNGYTIFNRIQMARVLDEWKVLANHIQRPEEETIVEAIKELAERCQGGAHLYLKFIGD